MVTTDPTFVIEQPVGSLAIHDLTLGAADDRAPVVVAIHGITANGLSWHRVAEEVGHRHGPGAVRFLAPDLRGRAASRGLPPPYGLRQHVADLASLTAVFGAKPLIVGHSMGAFVAALAVASLPERFTGAVLVDGGLALEPHDSDVHTGTARGADAVVDGDAALTAVLGPAMERLRMRFTGVPDYLAFWAGHPALGPILRGPAAQATQRYLVHDLVNEIEPGDEGTDGWRSSCVLDAVRADGADILADSETHGAVWAAAANGVPIDLVWAHRGLLDEPKGLYSSASLAALALPPEVRVQDVDANHYDVILDDPGVTAVADAIDAHLSRLGLPGTSASR